MSTIDIERDRVYREVAGTTLRVDLYRPKGQAPRAAVAYFHGGGWELGERTDYEAGRMVPLAEQGFLVASFQYRFTAVAPFPAQLEDARAAVEWLRGQASRDGVVGTKVGAWGASAGGHLAALLALGNPEAGERPDVEAGVAWFAAVDFSVLTGGSPLEREILPSATDALLGGSFDLGDPRHRAAHPLSLTSAGAAPLLLVTGDRDRVTDWSGSLRMHDALVRAGATSSLLVFGGAGHEDPRMDSPSTVGAVAGFFEEHLAAGR